LPILAGLEVWAIFSY